MVFLIEANIREYERKKKRRQNYESGKDLEYRLEKEAREEGKRRDEARRGEVRRGEVRRDETRRDETRRDETRRDEKRIGKDRRKRSSGIEWR